MEVIGDNTLFLNFGDADRAETFLKQRLDDPRFEGSTLKSFEVPTSFVDDLNDVAVPELKSKKLFPDATVIRVDETKARDQFGLKGEHIEVLQRAIIQGTGL